LQAALPQRIAKEKGYCVFNAFNCVSAIEGIENTVPFFSEARLSIALSAKMQSINVYQVPASNGTLGCS